MTLSMLGDCVFSNRIRFVNNPKKPKLTVKINEKIDKKIVFEVMKYKPKVHHNKIGNTKDRTILILDNDSLLKEHQRNKVV